MTLFQKLVKTTEKNWKAYTEHEFVRLLGEGSLPKAMFQKYLMQDYVFLVEFSRAYGLAVFRAKTLEEMREVEQTLHAIMEVEMGLHVRLCAEWEISEAELMKTQPLPQNKAYTDYVLSCGEKGDSLDLHIALAPCVIGYAHIAKALLEQKNHNHNPYHQWIEEYASKEYQKIAHAAERRLDYLGEGISEERFESIARIFDKASALEADFWQMAME